MKHLSTLGLTAAVLLISAARSEAEAPALVDLLKKAYCDGPPSDSDPCSLRARRPGKGVAVVAGFEWDNEDFFKRMKRRTGKVPPEAQQEAERTMRRLGVPADRLGQVGVEVWRADVDRSPPEELLVYTAYRGKHGEEGRGFADATFLMGGAKDGRAARVLFRFKESPLLIPPGELFSHPAEKPYDIADIDRDGRPEIILEHSDYDEHELIVYGRQGDGWKRVTSWGLE